MGCVYMTLCVGHCTGLDVVCNCAGYTHTQVVVDCCLWFM